MWNKFCASSWLNSEINILRCTVSKTSKFIQLGYQIITSSNHFFFVYHVLNLNLFENHKNLNFFCTYPFSTTPHMPWHLYIYHTRDMFRPTIAAVILNIKESTPPPQCTFYIVVVSLDDSSNVVHGINKWMAGHLWCSTERITVENINWAIQRDVVTQTENVLYALLSTEVLFWPLYRSQGQPNPIHPFRAF